MSLYQRYCHEEYRLYFEHSIDVRKYQHRTFKFVNSMHFFESDLHIFSRYNLKIV